MGVLEKSQSSGAEIIFPGNKLGEESEFRLQLYVNHKMRLKIFREWAKDHFQFSSVQSLSHVRLFAPHKSQHTRPPCPSPTPRVYLNPCSSSRWCHPAISSSVVCFSSCPQSFPALGSFPMCQLRMRWPKYLSFSFNISPFKVHPGLISFRMDKLDLLAVQGTLKSLLQHHS